MNIKNQTGLTLVELLITITLVAILLGIGVPNLTSFVKNNRILSQTNLFMVSVKTARSEAMSLRRTVTLCRSSDGENCGGSWSDGHIAFIDLNSDAVVDDDETILIANSYDNDGVGIALSYSGGNFVSFDRRGRAVGSSGAMTFCDDRGDDYARAIVIDPIGRSKPYAGTVSCGG